MLLVIEILSFDDGGVACALTNYPMPHAHRVFLVEAHVVVESRIGSLELALSSIIILLHLDQVIRWHQTN